MAKKELKRVLEVMKQEAKNELTVWECTGCPSQCRLIDPSEKDCVGVDPGVCPFDEGKAKWVQMIELPNGFTPK